MKNHSKILCVVLALIIALTAASCSLSKPYAYQKDDVELPVGVYILNLQQAYSEAQTLAQKSDLYDAENGTYDGKESFLKMEITDDDGETAVAEDWIIKRAKENTLESVAVMNKFNELGCTLDQAALKDTTSQIKDAWDQGYSEQYEPYCIGVDSLIAYYYTIPTMRSDAFKALYGVDGSSAVSDEDLAKYFEENYTAYKYFSANLYTTSTESDGAEEGSEVTTPIYTALSEDEIAAYQKDFDSYASTLSSGGSFDDVLKQYMDAYNVTEDTHYEDVTVIDDDTTSEILKALKDMKDGQAMTITIGEEDTSKQIYLVYREPIKNHTEEYTKTVEAVEPTEAEATDDEAALTAVESDPNANRNSVLQKMKSDEFDEILKGMVKDSKYTLSSACDSYKPSMFESKS